MDVDASCVSRIPKKKKKKEGLNEKTGTRIAEILVLDHRVDRMRGRNVGPSEKWEMGTRIRSEISSCACIIGRRNALRQAWQRRTKRQFFTGGNRKRDWRTRGTKLYTDDCLRNGQKIAGLIGLGTESD